jgi:hypothetical protein
LRLVKVKHGHRLPQQLKLKLIGLIMGEEAPDVVRTLYYRPEFFGKPISHIIHRALRGPSDWSVGERELFASFVSHLNKCRF